MQKNMKNTISRFISRPERIARFARVDLGKIDLSCILSDVVPLYLYIGNILENIYGKNTNKLNILRVERHRALRARRPRQNCTFLAYFQILCLFSLFCRFSKTKTKFRKILKNGAVGAGPAPQPHF